MSQSRDRGELTPEEKANLICVGRYAGSRQAHRAATVLLATGNWYVVLPEPEDDGRFGIYVPSAFALEAADLILRNRKEEVEHPPDLTALWPSHSVSGWHLLIAPAILVLVFAATATEMGTVILEWGRFDSQRIRGEGEWWRLLTPLFLHADAAHLWGNILGGLFFGYFVARQKGVAMAYGTALVGGVGGNFLNLLTFWYGSHLSIGASTAVFALLGGLIGLRCKDLLGKGRGNRIMRSYGKWTLIGVIGAGLALLGFLGAGGERTDVLAHLYGFVAGFAWIMVWTFWKQKR
ncbi:MAG: rhomboid family intramembrane serine protease [Opitutales bacterium]|nr:rhomboid family intramembrane serine protease [Opitutales bacterium]MCH8540634.1 rhomboid family intramembrane serine protease [Opitutales bacterium]